MHPHDPVHALGTGSSLNRRQLATRAAAFGAAPAAMALAAQGFRPGLARAQDATPVVSPEETTPPPDFAGLGVDPQMQTVLDTYAALNPIAIASQEPFNARQLPLPADAVTQILSERGEPALQLVGRVTHTLVPGGEGELVARVYTPEGDGPFPVIVYFHGGGWVIANLDTYDASCRSLTNAAESVVVSVAYRQAPENPYPAAVEDAYAATQYVIENAAEFGGDPSMVAVAGESAGGNLATVTCLLAAQRGGRMPVHQVLVYPVTTFMPEGEAAESIEQMADAAPLNLALLEWFGMYYLPDMSAGSEPTASPLMADDLSPMPPATVILAELDPLRSQGQVYAQALQDAGVDTTSTIYEGVTHEFFGTGAVVDKAQEAVAEAAARLDQAFGGAATPEA